MFELKKWDYSFDEWDFMTCSVVHNNQGGGNDVIKEMDLRRLNKLLK